MRPLSTFKRGCSCTKCLSDRGQLTAIAAMSSNQTYAAQNSSLQSTIITSCTVCCDRRGSYRSLAKNYRRERVVWQIQTQRTTTKSTTTATTTSSASVTCQWTAVSGLTRDVSGAAARRTTCFRAVRRGHQRFCASCVAQLEQQARGCPICHIDISMVLRLY